MNLITMAYDSWRGAPDNQQSQSLASKMPVDKGYLACVTPEVNASMAATVRMLVGANIGPAILCIPFCLS